MDILVVGAGALGNEICSLLPRSFPIKRLLIIDHDRVEISNLHRQQFFRPQDVGKSKSQQLAHQLRIKLNIDAHYFNSRVELVPLKMIVGFNVAFCAVDNVETRLWLNGFVHEHSPQTTLIDVGTEGWMGHVRLVEPYITSCLYCTRDLFVKDDTIPICSLTGNPVDFADCVAWATDIGWLGLEGNSPADFDDDEHVKAIHGLATERAMRFGVAPLPTPSSTKELLVRILPNVISTTSFMAGLSVVVLANKAGGGALDGNFWFFNGQQGLNLSSYQLERDSHCSVCRR